MTLRNFLAQAVPCRGLLTIVSLLAITGSFATLALARALVKDPPILILDEATSMFDLEGEAALVEVCKVAFVGRTMVLITYRPESLKLANRVIHIADGGTYKGESLSPLSNSADVAV